MAKFWCDLGVNLEKSFISNRVMLKQSSKGVNFKIGEYICAMLMFKGL